MSRDNFFPTITILFKGLCVARILEPLELGFDFLHIVSTADRMTASPALTGIAYIRFGIEVQSRLNGQTSLRTSNPTNSAAFDDEL